LPIAASHAETDVTDYPRLQAAIEAAEAQFGPTDCLINDAGFIHIGDFSKRAVDDLDYEIDVLFKGVVHGCRAVLPGMIARKRGTIVNVSSIGDRRPGPSGEIYHASKAAVRSLAELLQQAEAKSHPHHNIAPGLVKTNIHQTMGIRSKIPQDARQPTSSRPSASPRSSCSPSCRSRSASATWW
jgi:NADP-dependent 3-hydroxy acid dehydrogenase YdfG